MLVMGTNLQVTPACDYKCFGFQTQKWLYFDTYAMPGALVWGDRYYLTKLKVWEGSRPEIEGSGTKQ